MRKRLVVIDPDNAEQVERLTQALADHNRDIAGALREFGGLDAQQ